MHRVRRRGCSRAGLLYVDDIRSCVSWLSPTAHRCWVIIGKNRTIFGRMAMPSRLARLRDGVPVYQYRADSDTPPVSVIRAAGGDLMEHGVHIYYIPTLRCASSAGLVYLVAARAS